MKIMLNALSVLDITRPRQTLKRKPSSKGYVDPTIGAKRYKKVVSKIRRITFSTPRTRNITSISGPKIPISRFILEKLKYCPTTSTSVYESVPDKNIFSIISLFSPPFQAFSLTHISILAPIFIEDKSLPTAIPTISNKAEIIELAKYMNAKSKTGTSNICINPLIVLVRIWPLDFGFSINPALFFKVEIAVKTKSKMNPIKDIPKNEYQTAFCFNINIKISCFSPFISSLSIPPTLKNMFCMKSIISQIPIWIVYRSL